MKKLSLSKDKIRVLLLEGVHDSAVRSFQDSGYKNITRFAHALPEDELKREIKSAHFLGIRSRSQINAAVLAQAKRLAAVGCFCIGTNQVDLATAEKMGVPVFNAPFSNTRSVAELVLAEIIYLMRRIPEKNAKAHRGIWQKTATDAYEIRGKKLGIIGYGHIGTQLGIMAESLGMRVCYYDIEHKLPLGNASPVDKLKELLGSADVVSLHVPETTATRNMIGARELAMMKKGSYLINAARGTVVDIDALVSALRTGHIGGAAVDVFPVEPGSNDDEFVSPLREFDNVILTPHIGGSTQEAQENIAVEVAGKLVKYSDNGSTMTAVNFPQVAIPDHYDKRRILHIHHNSPGVLERINRVFSDQGVNIAAQYLQTSREIGYVVMDVELDEAGSLVDALLAIKGTIRTRLLH
ncbi:MAG: phosphoglycerate dehydrogenase [Gammaproteobacteria bacterium]|nr:phosphoglycerate dehydrogenase [Gammaproteobacteria bacterium]